MKITAISKLLYKAILGIINSIELPVFRDFCNIAKNKNILFYNSLYHMATPFNGGSYGRVVQSWSKEFPILNNIDYSLALIVALLILLLAARHVLKTLNVQASPKQVLTLPRKPSLLPLVYVSQLLDARGGDVSILDILLMRDLDIAGNQQLMQYKLSVGFIMNMSSKYLNSWALGLLRPIELGADKIQYKPTNKLAKKLFLIRKKLANDFDPDED